ncbi:NlpC/P60 family protein [Actinoplanes sp. CA-054009]
MNASVKIFLVGALGCLLLGPLALVGFVAMAQQSTSPGCAPSPAGRVDPEGDWTRAQVVNATTIVTVGIRRGVPARGWVIAVATAIQESRLTNLGDLGDRNDHDSLGLFQQRPSQGWGTPEQIMDPVYASTKFYQSLLRINDWQEMPLTTAAQAVQKSAYPDAYAKWENDAEKLVGTSSGDPQAIAVDLDQCVKICPTVTATTGEAGASCAEPNAIFARARSWLTAWAGGPVPYLSSNAPGDLFRGYRRDCSGYVSMALGLPGPGMNTIQFAQHSTVIAKTELKPGDLMIKPDTNLNGHVVLFAGWTDTSMSSYYGYEQSGKGGTHYRKIPYPYFGAYSMTPYRLGN